MTDIVKTDSGRVINPSRDPTTVYLASLSKGSQRAMYEGLCLLGSIVRGGEPLDDPREIPWERMTFSETAAIRAKLIEREYAPAYSNKLLSALRGVLRSAWRLELMDAETFHRAIDLPPMNGARVPAGRDASAEELKRLFRSCREDRLHLRGMRDAAILSLAYGTGLRRNEIAGVTFDQFSYETRSLVVTGKGNRQRLVPIPSWAAENVQGWVRIRGTDPGALISPLSLDGLRLLPIRHVEGQSIYAAIRKRVKMAGVKSLTPHDFRRTLATELLDKTKDLVAVQHILGHRSPATTQVYLKGIERQKRAAADVLADPEVA